MAVAGQPEVMPAQFGGGPLRMIVQGQVSRVFLLEAAAIVRHLRKGVGVNIVDAVVAIERFPA